MIAASAAQWLTGGQGLGSAGGLACSRISSAQICVLCALRVGNFQEGWPHLGGGTTLEKVALVACGPWARGACQDSLEMQSQGRPPTAHVNTDIRLVGIIVLHNPCLHRGSLVLCAWESLAAKWHRVFCYQHGSDDGLL